MIGGDIFKSIEDSQKCWPIARVWKATITRSKWTTWILETKPELPTCMRDFVCYWLTLFLRQEVAGIGLGLWLLIDGLLSTLILFCSTERLSVFTGAAIGCAVAICIPHAMPLVMMLIAGVCGACCGPLLYRFTQYLGQPVPHAQPV